MKDRVVLAFSGGCDSTSLLYSLLRDDKVGQVHLVSLNYGQKHKKELESAKQIVEHASETYTKIKSHKILELDLSELGNSSVLTNKNNQIPDQSSGEQTKTVVPYRNMLFSVLLASRAKAVDASKIYIGAVLDDLLSYPDCRPIFYESLQSTLRLCGETHNLKILTPFIEMDKAEIIRDHWLFQDITPLKYSWTCYRGEQQPCLQCDSCVERTRSFYLNDIQDPALDETKWKQAVEVFLSSNLSKSLEE